MYYENYKSLQILQLYPLNIQVPTILILPCLYSESF